MNYKTLPKQTYYCDFTAIEMRVLHQLSNQSNGQNKRHFTRPNQSRISRITKLLHRLKDML